MANHEVVRRLTDAMLNSLLTVKEPYSVDELVSASLTVSAALIGSIAHTPGVNLEPVRLLLAAMYSSLPAETVN